MSEAMAAKEGWEETESALEGLYLDADSTLAQLRHQTSALPSLASDPASGPRLLALEGELSESLRERADALAALAALRRTTAEAAAEAEERRELAEKAQGEAEGLRARVAQLERENGKLTEENVALVGHNNLRQKIHMHAKVKEENNALKHEKLAHEQQLSRQKKVIERLTQRVQGLDKENACPAIDVEEEERLSAALKAEEREARALRAHLLALLTLLHDATHPGAEQQEPKAWLEAVDTEHNREGGKKGVAWEGAVLEASRGLRELQAAAASAQRDLHGAELKIRLLEQSARLVKHR